MKLFKHIDFKHNDKIANKAFSDDAVFLHHTGFMLGIGTAVDSNKGIDRICTLKMRDSSKGFVILVKNVAEIFEYADDLTLADRKLIEQYLPGNLTVIVKCSNPLFANVALNGTVAFRVPQNQVLCHFLDIIGKPIVSTSINRSNYDPETELKKIHKEYGSWFDFGMVPKRAFIFGNDKPSTIISLVKGLKCIREGSIPFYEIKQSHGNPLVMFVCTGNVCRSPIAEYLFQDEVTKNKLNYRSESTGILQDGMTISANSASLLLLNGIEAAHHLSRKVTEEQLRSSWLILTMEESHKRYLMKNYPQYMYKTFTLLEFAGESGDIDDPYKKDIEDYKVAYKIIEDKIQYLISILKDEVSIDD